jgi:cytidylate kinase
MAKCVITIDGPAASGKSTAARLLAKKLGAVFLDTGAMYRAVTLAAMQAGVNLENDQLVADVLDKNCFSFMADKDKMIASINGRYVTEQLRDIEVTSNAKYISASPEIRQRLVQMQREFADNYEKIVTEGRDQGTIAFPDADVKFFLTADLNERARRRQAELSAKGKIESLESIKKAIDERDKSDRSRTVGPLKPAEDAITIDSTGLSIEQMIDKLLEIVKTKCSKKK